MYNYEFITIDIGMGEKKYSLAQLFDYYNIDEDTFKEFYEYIIDFKNNPKFYLNLFAKKKLDLSIYELDKYQELIYAKIIYKSNLLHKLENSIKPVVIDINDFKILFLNEDNSENRLNLDETLESMLKTDKIALTLESFNKIESILNRGYLSKEKNEELFNKLLIDYNI